MKMKSGRVCGGIMLCLAPTICYAEKEDTSILGTMTVTAQKQEENVQDVPISMTVFDEVAIEDRKIESVQDIAPYTSNFFLLNKSGDCFTPSIRGISNPVGAALSQPTSVIVDGIPVSNHYGFDKTIIDIERIEVLKGPQGTLYGKDAQAGVINIISKKPDNEKRGRIGVELGTDNKRQYTVSVSGPVVEDKLFVGVSAKHYEKDGFIENTLLGGYFNDKENDYGRVNLRYTPTDNLEISLISSRLEYDNGGLDYIVPDDINDGSVSADENGYDRSITTSHSLKVSYDINDYLLESVTTYRDIDTDALYIYNAYDVDSNGDHDKYSQEFRISNGGDSFKWVAGIYGEIREVNSSSDYVYPSVTYPSETYRESDSLGVFIHTDYAINDKFSFVSGVRYDKDNEEFENKKTGETLDLSDNDISPKVSLKYRHSAGGMYYATISRGYRPGGFWTNAPDGYSPKYDSETLWNYEIGAKNSFFDGRLMVNSAIFYMQIDDMQVKVWPIAGSNKAYVDNASDGTSKGVEVELIGRVTDTIELSASYGYTDCTFGDYKDAKDDYSGNKNTFTPTYNYNIGIKYRNPRGFFARVDLNGYGKTYFNVANTNSRDPYSLVNAKIGYEAEGYDIYLYGKNVFDEEYDSVSIFGGNGVVYSPPGEIGVQLIYRF